VFLTYSLKPFFWQKCRLTKKNWLYMNFLGETLYFESLDLTLSVEESYHRVQNEDMADFFSNKAE
jgi:hypothetical protein